MTTIVWDGKSLAADGLATENGNFVASTKRRKIFRLKDGRYFAAAGSLSSVHRMRKFLDGEEQELGLPADVNHEACGFLISPNGRKAELFWESGRRCDIYEPDAVGSGSEYARVAMGLGLSAKEACKVACKWDVYSGGRIQEVRFE